MLSDFGARFDSFYSARRDYSSYLEAKGYRSEGDRTVWEPTDPVDLEPETTNYGPGAAVAGELLDDIYQDSDEPNLFYDELDEPDVVVGSEEITVCVDGKYFTHYYDADTEF